jgi:hypothetical protein
VAWSSCCHGYPAKRWWRRVQSAATQSWPPKGGQRSCKLSAAQPATARPARIGGMVCQRFGIGYSLARQTPHTAPCRLKLAGPGPSARTRRARPVAAGNLPVIKDGGGLGCLVLLEDEAGQSFGCRRAAHLGPPPLYLHGAGCDMDHETCPVTSLWAPWAVSFGFTQYAVPGCSSHSLDPDQRKASDHGRSF